MVTVFIWFILFSHPVFCSFRVGSSSQKSCTATKNINASSQTSHAKCFYNWNFCIAPTKIRTIWLTGFTFDPHSISSFQFFLVDSQIAALSLVDCNLDDAFLKKLSISSLSKLKSLTITSALLSPAAISQLIQELSVKLTHLKISKCLFMPSNISFDLGRLVNLKNLHLEDLIEGCFNWRKILLTLPNLHQLKHLSLPNNNIVADIVLLTFTSDSTNSKYIRLKSLNIEGNSFSSNSSDISLPYCLTARLESLHIGNLSGLVSIYFEEIPEYLRRLYLTNRVPYVNGFGGKLHVNFRNAFTELTHFSFIANDNNVSNVFPSICELSNLEYLNLQVLDQCEKVLLADGWKSKKLKYLAIPSKKYLDYMSNYVNSLSILEHLTIYGNLDDFSLFLNFVQNLKMLKSIKLLGCQLSHFNSTHNLLYFGLNEWPRWNECADIFSLSPMIHSLSLEFDSSNNFGFENFLYFLSKTTNLNILKLKLVDICDIPCNCRINSVKELTIDMNHCYFEIGKLIMLFPNLQSLVINSSQKISLASSLTFNVQFVECCYSGQFDDDIFLLCRSFPRIISMRHNGKEKMFFDQFTINDFQYYFSVIKEIIGHDELTLSKNSFLLLLLLKNDQVRQLFTEKSPNLSTYLVPLKNLHASCLLCSLSETVKKGLKFKNANYFANIGRIHYIFYPNDHAFSNVNFHFFKIPALLKNRKGDTLLDSYPMNAYFDLDDYSVETIQLAYLCIATKNEDIFSADNDKLLQLTREIFSSTDYLTLEKKGVFFNDILKIFYFDSSKLYGLFDVTEFIGNYNRFFGKETSVLMDCVMNRNLSESDLKIIERIVVDFKLETFYNSLDTMEIASSIFSEIGKFLSFPYGDLDRKIRFVFNSSAIAFNFDCSICLQNIFGEPFGIFQHHEELEFESFHMFHEDCLEQWLIENGTCPLCLKTGILIKQNKEDF